jgi:hypothetical protein
MSRGRWVKVANNFSSECPDKINVSFYFRDGKRFTHCEPGTFPACTIVGWKMGFLFAEKSESITG